MSSSELPTLLIILGSMSIIIEDISEAPSDKKSGKCPEYSMKLLAAMFLVDYSLQKWKSFHKKRLDEKAPCFAQIGSQT